MDILRHDPDGVTHARSTSDVVEVIELGFEGGVMPQFNIQLTTPIIGGQSYTFAGNVKDYTSGCIVGLLPSCSSDTIHADGPFSSTFVANASADGATTFAIRSGSGAQCVLTLDAYSLTPA